MLLLILVVGAVVGAVAVSRCSASGSRWGCDEFLSPAFGNQWDGPTCGRADRDQANAAFNSSRALHLSASKQGISPRPMVLTTPPSSRHANPRKEARTAASVFSAASHGETCAAPCPRG